MKRVFIVSLCREGILGGGLYVDEEKVTYRTGKVTVPDWIRNLELRRDNILQISMGWMLFFPTVTFKMDSNAEFKFIIFRRRVFYNTMKEIGYAHLFL